LQRPFSPLGVYFQNIDNYRRTGNTGVYDLSILMGHESIETAKRYEHFAHEMIAVENCNSHLDNIYLK